MNNSKDTNRKEENEVVDIHSNIGYTQEVVLLGDVSLIGPKGTPFSSRDCSIIWNYYPTLQHARKEIIELVNKDSLKRAKILAFGMIASKWVEKNVKEYVDVSYITHPAIVYKWRDSGGRYYGKYDVILKQAELEVEKFLVAQGI